MTESYPPSQPQVEFAYRIGEEHFAVARRLAADEVFDWDAAEIVLRAPAVFADRLSPGEFSELSDSVQNGYRSLADVVYNRLGAKVEMQLRPNENPAEYEHRTSVHDVMHAFQKMVLIGPKPAEGGYTPEHEHMVREGVLLASQLFTLGLPEAVEKNFVDVVQSLSYFNEKTQQAIQYAGRYR